MRSLKYKYQNALSSFQCIAAFFCFVRLCVIFCVIQHCLLLLQYSIIMLLPMQQYHELYQANSFPSHHILLCPNAITSCSVLSSKYFCCIIFHLYHIVLLPFIVGFLCQIIASPQQSDTGLSWLLHSMFPPEEKESCNLVFSLIVCFLLVIEC